jgi:geranylgeranylglycerol-phosphate geranylgeranyltransferase
LKEKNAKKGKPMFTEYIKITRPANVLISFVSIFIGALVSGGFTLNNTLLFAALTAALVTAGANVINDIFDIEIDRINQPRRPLPAGKISIRGAKIYFTVFYLTALILAWFCGRQMFIAALLVAALLYWYSAALKKTVLWGNLLVAAVGGFTFVYGAMSVGDWHGGIMPALLAFFFHFGRELIKDMQDIDGDLKEGALTFVGKYGRQKSIILTKLIFSLLIAVTIIPYFLKIYNDYYLIIVILGVDTVLLYVIFSLKRQADEALFGRLSRLLKLDMIIGLLAIYAGL